MTHTSCFGSVRYAWIGIVGRAMINRMIMPFRRFLLVTQASETPSKFEKQGKEGAPTVVPSTELMDSKLQLSKNRSTFETAGHPAVVVRLTY